MISAAFRSIRLLPVALFLAYALTSSLSLAQGIVTGTILGTVQDGSGAVVSGAVISATNTGTGLESKAMSNGSGEFSINEVPIGSYKLVVSAGSFSPLTVSGLTVQSGVTASTGVLKLSVGNAEAVTVETAQAILETSQAQITTTFDAQQIADLPTGGRLDALTLLVPGVARTLGDNFSNTNGVGFGSNGQRGRSNNFEIDGQSNNDNSIAGPQIFFRNEDAVQEIQIVTNNFSAQYGRNIGSVVNYVTKSGTNSFHGTAFENYFGSWGSSLTQAQKSPLFGYCSPGQTTACTVPIVPRVTANEFGGTVGGPIIRDKLFFFGGTLWRRVTNGASPSISTNLTPTPDGLTMLQADFPNNSFVAALVNQGPYAVKAGGPTVPAAFTPVQKIVCQSSSATCPAGTPSFSIPFATIQRLLPSTAQDQEHIGRLDYQFTSKDRLFLRYIYQKAPTFVAGGTVSSGSYYDNTDIAHSIGADLTHIFSPHWVDQLRYSFQQTTLIFGGGGYPSCINASINLCSSNFSLGSGQIGFGPATNIPQGRIVKATQVQNNATWNFGKQTIQFGGEFDYQNSPNIFLPNTSGAFNFQNFNSALADIGTLSLANGNPSIPFREPDVAAYLEDDWKVTPALTVNMGLRWEFFKQSVNLLHDVSVARQTGSNPLWNTALPLSQTTQPYYSQNYKNFEPRFGFAYNPTSMPKLVARGGFAIGFDPAFYNLFLNVYTAAPVVNTGVIQCNGTVVNCIPSGGSTNASVHAQDDALNPTGGDPGAKVETYLTQPFRNPYSENYTFGFQYEATRSSVIEVRYVGNHAVHLFQSLNANQAVNVAPPVSAVPAAQNYLTLAQAFPGLYPAGSYCTTAGALGIGRRNCLRTTEYQRGNTAFSIYNAIQTNLRIQSRRGLAATLAYTWSRTIDNTSEAYSTGNSGGGTGGNTVAYAPNPQDSNVSERGLSGISFPQVTSASIVYAPKIYEQQHGLIGRLLGGYQVNMLYSFQSGQPYTPAQTTKGLGQSPAVSKIPTSNQGQALYSFCDYGFNTNIVGVDTCRPILSNASAPAGTVGVNGGPGVGYLDIATGNSISPVAVKWLVNNQYEAEARGTPFPGVGRNTLIGNTVDNVDASIFKKVNINERFSGQLRLNVFNVLNRAYYGTPDALVNDYYPGTHSPSYSSFENYQANTGGNVGTPFGKGTRNIQIGAKLLF